VWNIPVACLLANALGPTWETEQETGRTFTGDAKRGTITVSDVAIGARVPKRGGCVVFTGQWSGPKGRPPPLYEFKAGMGWLETMLIRLAPNE
jgi:hypothetical protein